MATERMRALGAAVGVHLAPPGVLKGYIVGRGGPQPFKVALIMLGTFDVLATIVWLALGPSWIPGLLVLLFAVPLASPPVGVLVYVEGVALVRRSIWHGRPTQLVSVDPVFEVVPTETGVARTRVRAGRGHLWVSASELARLRATLMAPAPPTVWPPWWPGPGASAAGLARRSALVGLAALMVVGPPATLLAAWELTGYPPLQAVSVIATGAGSSCALHAGGRPVCWGRWSTGGPSGGGLTKVLPGAQAVSLVPAATSLAVGSGFACATTTERRLWCWGAGRPGPGAAPALDAVPINSPAPAVEVAGGESGWCVTTGPPYTVSCWKGQPWLGHATPIGLAGVLGLSIGGREVCGVSTADTVVCVNRRGGVALGRPHTVGGLQDATEVAVGTRHGCALRTRGRVECWGDDSLGELGDGNVARSAPSPGAVAVDAPVVAVAGLSDAVSISAGGSATCAVRQTGAVVCWGTFQGAVGLPTRRVPTTVPGITNALWVATSSDHACAVLSDNRAVCWGSNTDHQLGDGQGLLYGHGGKSSTAGVTVRRAR